MGMDQELLEDSGTGIEMGQGGTLEIGMAPVGISETEMMINLDEGISEMTTGGHPEGMMTVGRLEGILGEGMNQGERNRIGPDQKEILRTDRPEGISEMMIGEHQDVISRIGTMIVDLLIGVEIVLHLEKTENHLEDEKIQVIANVAVEWVAGELDLKGKIQDHLQNETINPFQDQSNQDVMTQHLQLPHHRKMGAGQLSANVSHRLRHEITA